MEDGDRVGLKHVYLWSIPRTLSTAVLRAMSTVDEYKAVHQPYMGAFYKENKHRPNDVPEAPSAPYPDIRDHLAEMGTGYKLVFIKEMAKHLAGRLDDLSYIPDGATHTFIIRHPAKTMKSYIATWLRYYEKSIPDETERVAVVAKFLTEDAMSKEVSFEFLNRIFDIVTSKYKQRPLVIDADDLQRDPEGTLRAYCQATGVKYHDSMIHWGPITPAQKDIYRHRLDYLPEVVMAFHGRVFNATEFFQSEPEEVDLEDVDKEYRAILEENIPIYEKLREFKINPIKNKKSCHEIPRVYDDIPLVNN